jgi:hypothetical protein
MKRDGDLEATEESSFKLHQTLTGFAFEGYPAAPELG